MVSDALSGPNSIPLREGQRTFQNMAIEFSRHFAKRIKISPHSGRFVRNFVDWPEFPIPTERFRVHVVGFFLGAILWKFIAKS